MTVKDYIRKFRQFIKDRLRNTTLLPSIVMAHALYEAADDDGYIGKSDAASYNNHVRMPADASWKGPKVKLNVRDNTWTRKRIRKAWFRIYDSSEDSIADRIEMLSKKITSWPTAVLHSDMLRAQAGILQLATENNDPRYGERIVKLIDKHRLYLLDTRWIVEYVLKTLLTIGLVRAAIYFVSMYWDAIVPWR
ncbi:MAG: glucosaminidase domain-containing protein [Chryseolinea sp.]